MIAKKKTAIRKRSAQKRVRTTSTFDRLILTNGITDAGEQVTETTALNLSAVYAAIRVIAETVASLPLCIYSEDSSGNKERDKEHPLYTLIHDAPNQETTSFVWRETLQAHLLTWGNAYCEIERDNTGLVIGLWQLRPDMMVVRRNATTHQIEYWYNTVGPIPADKILHIPGLGFDGIYGYSPITLNREAIGLGLAAQKYGSQFFSNSSVPSGLLEHPGVLDDIGRQNLKESFKAMTAGRSIGVLEEGIKWQSIGIPNEDSQYLETRQFQIQEVARIFRLPPHKIGDLSRATFSNIEQMAIEFVQDSILPWLKRWEQELNRKLFASEPGYYAEFVLDGLLRGDTQSRYNAYSVGRNGGWLSVNDIRSLENMNPVEGGDVYLLPLNMTPADDTTDDTTEETPVEEQQVEVEAQAVEEDNLTRAFLPLAESTLRRLLTKEANAITRMVGKTNCEAKTREFYLGHKDTLYAAVEPILIGLAVARQVDPKIVDQYLQPWCERKCGEYLLQCTQQDLTNTRESKIEAEAIELLKGFINE